MRAFARLGYSHFAPRDPRANRALLEGARAFGLHGVLAFAQRPLPSEHQGRFCASPVTSVTLPSTTSQRTSVAPFAFTW